MLFNTLRFILFFLPVALGIALRLRGRALLRWLTLASFFFYAFAGHTWFLIPMLITTVLDFYMAPLIAGAREPARKRGLLMVSLCGNLGLLFYFKYSFLIAQTVQSAWVFAVPGHDTAPYWVSLFRVMLPAGISFYTFQTLSYVIDVYRGEAHAETDFWKFAGFVSFFPHLVAGPLTRHNQLIPPLTRIAEQGIRPRWREGVFLFAAGLCKKVLVADRIAAFIDPVINDAGTMGFATAWLALFGYALQIYFDFSGYSDMAVGLGRLFDIELPMNFDSPYKAANPSDFWRRWHITLSSWLKDYLYISLGGSRCSPLRRDFNLMATMLIGGLWHGANWTFAAWGFYHGALLIVFRYAERPWSHWPAAIQRTVTFVAVCLGWVFFRSETFPQAALWFSRLFTAPRAATPTGDEWLMAGLVGAALLGAHLLPSAIRRDWRRLTGVEEFALGLATVVAVLFMNYSSRFLYFQF